MPEQNNEVLLRVENLSQHFGSLKAVNKVSFDIHKGEVFGLVGESGCGKTTTGRTIIKLYNATGGNVYFRDRRIVAGTLEYEEAIKNCRSELKDTLKKLNGELNNASAQDREKINAQIREEKEKAKNFIAGQNEEIKKARHDQKYCNKDYAKYCEKKLHEEYLPKINAEKDPEQKKKLEKEYHSALKIAKNQKIVTKIQMIFQDSIASLNPRMTVREIISEGLVIQGIKDKKYIDEQVYNVLERVGLVREHAGRYPHEFSGGQRQRIGIARSIVMRPDIIIADEPISALDVSIQAQVINLLNELRNDLGLTILFIAHDLSVVKYFSDRIGVMYFGNMVEMAKSEELFAHPLHPYTKALFSDIPTPDPHFEKQRKRITYNSLRDHDYSTDKPSFREVAPGHFVMCNNAEFAKYRKELGLE